MSESKPTTSPAAGGGATPAGATTTTCPATPPPAFIRLLENANVVIPASESLQVSNFVTTDQLPDTAASTFAATSTDPDNFRIEVEDPCAGASVSASLEVLRGATVITSTTYTLSAKAGVKLRSIYLRLVSDADDDAASGHGAASDPDSQTVHVKLDDVIRATYTPASLPAVTVQRPVGRPKSENNNGANGRLHDIRELKLNITVFQRPGMVGTPARTRAEVQTDIDTVNERLAQSCIRINVVAIDMGGAGDPGVVLPAALAGGFTQTPGIVPALTASEAAVVGMLDADANSVDVFYVDTITNTPRATSYPAVRNGTANPNAKNFLVMSRGAQVLTMSHELMHILLNLAHRTNEPAESLFRGGTTASKAVGGTKRIGPYPQAAAVGVGNADTTTIRGAAETLP